MRERERERERHRDRDSENGEGLGHKNSRDFLQRQNCKNQRHHKQALPLLALCYRDVSWMALEPVCLSLLAIWRLRLAPLCFRLQMLRGRRCDFEIVRNGRWFWAGANTEACSERLFVMVHGGVRKGCSDLSLLFFFCSGKTCSVRSGVVEQGLVPENCDVRHNVVHCTGIRLPEYGHN